MQHNARYMAIGASTVSSEAVASLVVRPCVCVRVVIVAQGVVVDGMRVSSAFGGEEHLNAYDDKDGRHGDKTGHGRVALVPKVRETWVGEGFEGGGEKVDEGSRYEHAGAEVSREEEEARGHWDCRESLHDDGEGASCLRSA